ncbi:thiopeptide-type bacteriocin biosynthesis protein [Micromonospora sp. NPDC047793]|uniref:thiopeptide-type bacteriocin biosynthesis protein n=1 Tax=Micromonospora sp. NPDC047793 TaxID=3154342 RepID=UPI0033D3C7E0
MDEIAWKQVNIHYPGHRRHDREQAAVPHLRRVLPAAETAGLISAWWFIRKGPWRIRYLPTTAHHWPEDPSHRLLTDGVVWTSDTYEPETHAFGGLDAMDAAHTLFHHDSHHLLTYLHGHPTDRRERSLILCTALMRAAGLDLNEQGDVWARVAQRRADHLSQRPAPDLDRWRAFTEKVHYLLLGSTRAPNSWHTGFESTGTTLRGLRDTGRLTRGLRAVIVEHLIFHWNRIGIPAAAQATLAQAATEALFGHADECLPGSRGTGQQSSPPISSADVKSACAAAPQRSEIRWTS